MHNPGKNMIIKTAIFPGKAVIRVQWQFHTHLIRT